MKVDGWADLADDLHMLSRTGRWDEMPALIDDDVLATFAVVAEPGAVAAELLRRYTGVMTRMTLQAPYAIDAGLLAGVAATVRASTG